MKKLQGFILLRRESFGKLLSLLMFFTAVKSLEANVFPALNAADIAINRGNPPQQNALPISTSNDLLGSFATDTFGLTEKGEVLSELDVEAKAIAAGESPVLASAPGSLTSPKTSAVNNTTNPLPAGTVNVAAANVVTPSSFFSQNPGMFPLEVSKLTVKAGQVACGDGPTSVCGESLKQYGAEVLKSFDKYLEQIGLSGAVLKQGTGTLGVGNKSIEESLGELGASQQQTARSPAKTSVHANGNGASSPEDEQRGVKLSDREIFEKTGGDKWKIITAPNGVLIKVPKDLITWSESGKKIKTRFDNMRIPYLVFVPDEPNHLQSMDAGTVKLVTGCLCAGLEQESFIKDILSSLKSPEHYRDIVDDSKRGALSEDERRVALIKNMQNAMNYQLTTMNGLKQKNPLLFTVASWLPKAP